MRAEAKFRSGDVDGALTDINELRNKRHVSTYKKERAYTREDIQ
jgi:hypothetical protein